MFNVVTIMEIAYDPHMRAETLGLRGIDMADAGEVFAGPHLTVEDVRFAYGEPRFITIGFLRQRMVIVAWTPRAGICRVISMRKANAREIARYTALFQDLDR